MTDKMTRSEEIAADVSALIRARNPLIWIVTREEARVERYVAEAAAAAGYAVWNWDVAQGVTDLAGEVQDDVGSSDPIDTLRAIQGFAAGQKDRRDAWIMRDLPPWLEGLAGAPTVRHLKNLARYLPSVQKEKSQVVIVMSPTGAIPPELSNHATVIDWPIPDRTEIEEILEVAIDSLPPELQKKAATNGVRESAIDAAVGLSGEEAAACYAKSIVQFRKIDPVTVAKEKKRVVARERVLEYYDPLPGGLDAVGGLENLKEWLVGRSSAYTPAARKYGLPFPRGSLFVGMSGCGKSLTAKATATAWQVPLLKLDMGALKSKFVGESEGNLRKALGVIEAIGRCVVWLDEVEKALAGATQGGADGGVSSDALGTLLTWMNERQGGSFVIATANDVEALPPEFLRKGRFDELWWVDLPTHAERVEILAAALRTHGRDGKGIDLRTVASECQDFTGAELAAIIPDAMFAAFADKGREINTRDLVLAASRVVPLAKTASDKVAKLRDWGRTRARPASKPEGAAPSRGRTGRRQVDL